MTATVQKTARGTLVCWQNVSHTPGMFRVVPDATVTNGVVSVAGQESYGTTVSIEPVPSNGDRAETRKP